MTILLVGMGDARDHAVFARLREERASVRFALLGENALLAREEGVTRVADVSAAVRLADRVGADVAVVHRPELLFVGAADALARGGRRVFGPNRRAARLEGSKLESKSFMTEHGVSTPAWKSFDAPEGAIRHLRAHWRGRARFVIKSELYMSEAHLRTIVPATLVEAVEAVHRLAQVPRRLRGRRILLERRIEGMESSVHLVLSGHTGHLAPPVSDYKSLFDDDVGPNTHGMGALAGGTWSPSQRAALQTRILEPTMRGLQKEQRGYDGILYIGVVWTQEGPTALEYNVRPGNPEWVALLPLLVDRLEDLLRSRLPGPPRWHAGVASGCAFVTVPGYPFIRHRHAVPVLGLQASSKRARILGEGVRGERTLLAGDARSMCVVASARSVGAMRKRLYAALQRIRFPGMHYRTDIGLHRPVRITRLRHP